MLGELSGRQITDKGFRRWLTGAGAASLAHSLEGTVPLTRWGEPRILLAEMRSADGGVGGGGGDAKQQVPTCLGNPLARLLSDRSLPAEINPPCAADIDDAAPPSILLKVKGLSLPSPPAFIDSGDSPNRSQTLFFHDSVHTDGLAVLRWALGALRDDSRLPQGVYNLES